MNHRVSSACIPESDELTPASDEEDEYDDPEVLTEAEAAGGGLAAGLDAWGGGAWEGGGAPSGGGGGGGRLGGPVSIACAVADVSVAAPMTTRNDPARFTMPACSPIYASVKSAVPRALPPRACS
ncbi:MAG: hypothetical protein ACRELB_19180, partial [Polyangiaceae bacterium]